MTGQVIMSVAYGIDVLPENDPYVADSEKMLQALAIGSTPEAALLDAIPWCNLLPRVPVTWELIDIRTVINMPSFQEPVSSAMRGSGTLLSFVLYIHHSIR